ncbi:MAG: hypothetical protein EA366_00085 [Spirulina sp. DLM2.Bin59]|nr:MAG: hypothetical protein EA366_00085 [Spirulina sp. DLM2.Bin59]
MIIVCEPMNEPKPTATPQDAEAVHSSGSHWLLKTKLVTGAIAILVISGAAGYGIGRWQNQQLIRQQAEAYEMERETLTTELAAMATRSQLIEVRLLLLTSVDALEQRNFGAANTHLRRASETLDPIESSLDSEELAAVKQELSTLEINYTINPAEQRNLLVNLSDRLEALIPEI